MSKTRAWSNGTIVALLTPDRIQSYLTACGGDTAAALDLYVWNGEVAGALLATIGYVEVFTRNALDRQLTQWALSRQQNEWFNIAPLDQQGRADIAKARQRATANDRCPELHGKVVAELSFGFWRFLVAQRYHTSLWVPALHVAFPKGATDIRRRRREVERLMTDLSYVRNRAAHHEPIHRRNLDNDYQAVLTLASWIDPEAPEWIKEHSTLPEIISKKPV